MVQKRTRSDSSTAAVQAMKNASEDTLQPPAHAGLDKKAEPYWHDNIRTKALDSWTPSDLIECADLSNNQLRIIGLRKELASENRKRGEDRNPNELKRLDKQIAELGRVIAAQKRNLQIHSHATNGESRDQKKRNKNDADARRTTGRHQTEDDNLIAFPKHG